MKQIHYELQKERIMKLTHNNDKNRTEKRLRNYNASQESLSKEWINGGTEIYVIFTLEHFNFWVH